MLNYLWVMIGGALGTGARFWLSGVVRSTRRRIFSAGHADRQCDRLVCIGIFAAIADPQGPFLVSPRLRQFFMIGVCGGYTTFSSFSLQTLDLVQEGDWLKAALNTGLSVFCCLFAVWAGRIIGLALVPR